MITAIVFAKNILFGSCKTINYSNPASKLEKMLTKVVGIVGIAQKGTRRIITGRAYSIDTIKHVIQPRIRFST